MWEDRRGLVFRSPWAGVNRGYRTMMRFGVCKLMFVMGGLMGGKGQPGE